MGVKNKAEVNRGIKAGKLNWKATSKWFDLPSKDPLMFYNSDEFKKIHNRNKKRR